MSRGELSHCCKYVQWPRSGSEQKPAAGGAQPAAPHCQEFYHSLYPELGAAPCYYSYNRFSLPDATDGPLAVGQNVLKWFYIQNCLEEGVTCELETEGERYIRALSS